MGTNRAVPLVMLCGASFLATESLAQTASSSVEAAVPEGTLEEVVVTAQRRSENLQSVPIAVTAVTAASLERAGISDMLSLPAVVPGFTLTDDAGYSHIFLRGIGTTTTGASYEPSVATYIDGVYYGSNVQNMFSLNNIAQIEVLKGPQGTLFGRNATGGVVNITTRSPSSTPALEASVDYANYKTIEAKFYATTGIAAGLNADLAVYYRHQYDGWGYDPVTNSQIYRTNDLSLRSKWLWEPTDTTRLTFVWDHSDEQTDVGENLHFLPGNYGFDAATTYDGFFTSFAQHQDYVKTSHTGLSLKAEQDIGIARLVNILGFQDSNFGTRFDQDATPLNIVDATWTQPTNSLSEEFQVQSASDSKLKWIGGVFFLNQRVRFPFYLLGAAAAPFTTEFIGFSDRLTSVAGFGQATYEIVRDTNLTAGIRYTHDKHEALGAIYGDDELIPGTPAAPSETFSKVTWRIALDHKFTPDVLVYVSDNRGFKGGAFNQLTYQLPAVRPEVLDAYEIGTKTEWLDHRVRINAAAYDYEYKDIQVQVLPSGSQEVVNGAAARIYGLDTDWAAQITSNFSLSGGFAWIHGRYTSFPGCPSFVPAIAGNTQITIDCTGHDTVHTPAYSGDLVATYRQPVPIGEFTYALTYSYSNGYYPDPDNRLRQPITHLVNPSVTWNAPNQRYWIRVWAANALNEKYYQFLAAQGTGNVGSPAAPATYGITFGLRL